jgi:hypothetical protein
MGHLEQLRSVVIALALLFSITSSSAQSKYFGISGGLVSNVIAGSEADFQKQYYVNKMSHRTGPTFSLLVKREFNPVVYFKGEASYVRRGNISSKTLLWNINLEYASLPLKIGVQPFNFRKISAGFEGGASLNYTPGHGLDNIKAAYAAAGNDKVSQWGVSFLAGTNFEYRLSQRRIVFLNSTWYHDMTPMLYYEAGNAGYRAVHRGWLITVGVMNRLGNYKSKF